MVAVTTIASFLKTSVEDLVQRAEARGVAVLPSTHLGPGRLVETFGFTKANPTGRAARARPVVLALWVGGFALVAAAAFVGGFFAMYPLPEWLRPKPNALFFTMLGYLFWGLFSAVWGGLIFFRALKQRVLRGKSTGLVLDCRIEGRRTLNHYAYFVRVAVLYSATNKVFTGEAVDVGRTVPSFDVPPSKVLERAAARFSEGGELPVYFDERSPRNFSLKRQLFLKTLSLLTASAVLCVSLFFIALAGAVAHALA